MRVLLIGSGRVGSHGPVARLTTFGKCCGGMILETVLVDVVEFDVSGKKQLRAQAREAADSRKGHRRGSCAIQSSAARIAMSRLLSVRCWSMGTGPSTRVWLRSA